MTNFAMPTGVLNIGHISRVDSVSKELELLWLCGWFFLGCLSNFFWGQGGQNFFFCGRGELTRRYFFSNNYCSCLCYFCSRNL